MFNFVTAPAAALAIAFLLLAPGIGIAKDGVEFRADLEPCCGEPEPNAEGKKAEFKTQTKSGGTTQLDNLRIEVEIPVPSVGLGVTDAATADLRVVFSRAGVPYAECFLVLDEDEGTKAKFEVRIRQLSQNGSSVFRKATGQCDIDLATSGIQPGVPAVVADDVATVNSVVNQSVPVAIPFLQGAFAQH